MLLIIHSIIFMLFWEIFCIHVLSTVMNPDEIILKAYLCVHHRVNFFLCDKSGSTLYVDLILQANYHLWYFGTAWLYLIYKYSLHNRKLFRPFYGNSFILNFCLVLFHIHYSTYYLVPHLFQKVLSYRTTMFVAIHGCLLFTYMLASWSMT